MVRNKNSKDKNLLPLHPSPTSLHRCEATQGYIYILSNPSFGNLYKVGKTTRDPFERAEELSALTAVPTPFKVEFSLFVEYCSITEELIHRILEQRGYRISENREFFNAPIKEIKKVIRKFKKKPIILKTIHFKKQIKKFIQ